MGQDLTEKWAAFQLWENASHKGDINWDYLADNYGAQTVSATDCRSPPADPCAAETTLGEIIRGWLSAEADASKKDQPLLYVKDWHLPRWVFRNPAAQPFYTTPHLFADDWLNYHYCTFTDDDFRFVYLGIQGTSTPFHKDVYDSYSWSTNVVGRKLWTFWTPGDEARRQPGVALVQETGETVFVYVIFLRLSPPANLTVRLVPEALAAGTTLLRTSPLASRLITTGVTRSTYPRCTMRSAVGS